MEGPWQEVVPGRLPAELANRSRRMVFDHCQSSGGCEAVCSACFTEAVKDSPAVQIKRYFAAYGAAVDVLSHAGRSHVARAGECDSSNASLNLFLFV